MPESRDDARDDLAVLMPADQHIGPWSAIARRDHELLRVPKREDEMPALTIQRIHLLVALRIHPHRPPQPSNHRSSDRREQRELQPLFDSLHGGLHIGYILELHRMEPLVLPPAEKQLVVCPYFDNRPSGQDHDPIGPLNRGQSVGNDDGRSIFHQIGEGQLDDPFGLGVQGRRRFIKDEQRRVA